MPTSSLRVYLLYFQFELLIFTQKNHRVIQQTLPAGQFRILMKMAKPPLTTMKLVLYHLQIMMHLVFFYIRPIMLPNPFQAAIIT
ncbi:hypothetical protein AR543_10470 [Paenibacillus bovis]|uniref:Uncharacterized protein n=1 Tax=Paenibacillus bovis TaxID=1616788 RepID=A0A172ZFH0_9BACL|nr:hypothetical protein AR543_10470 [Paenibacillus bovis]